MADDEDMHCDEKTALKAATNGAADGDHVEMQMVDMQAKPPPASSKDPTAETQRSAGPTSAAAPSTPATGRTSRMPILFERSAHTWWNPRFDSEDLESQHVATAFPQTRRRFRYALGYAMLSCAAWCAFFGIQHEQMQHWPAFVGGTAVLLVISAVVFGFTFFVAYRRFVLPMSLVLVAALCSGVLLTFVIYNDRHAILMFAWSIEIVILIYTLIPMPLFVCVLAGASYSIGFEVMAAYFGEMTGAPRYVVGRALLHVCIHAVGVHNFVMSQVRERSTFLKVGQSLILRRALQTEKQLKHNMIHSLMPPKVAEEVMKSREAERGEDYDAPPSAGPANSRDMFRTFHMLQMDNVSILFADIVGFTKMSSNKSAEHLVLLLNDLFGRFDELCQRNSCEKISTLGDCYYCVSGCPEPRPDHAKCCVEMGLAMCIAIQQFDDDHNEAVNMRVGVHTGSVLCGLVGTRRFKFDVWSHDVTLANMMESEGKPGRVHVSDDTRKFIDTLYELEPGDEAEDIRKHKELIEQYDRTTGQYVVTSVEKRNVTTASMKTWFMVKRLFESTEAAVVSSANAANVLTIKSNPADADKVTIEVENSVADGGVRDQAENKDLSAVQLLGKRDHMMTSHEELNGDVSGASGTVMPRMASAPEEFDRQLLECMADEAVVNDYLYNPKINQCTLNFTKPRLEVAFRRRYDDVNQPTDSALTLAVPRYSSLADIVISFFFFFLVIICCFVGFDIRVPWVVVCVVGFTLESVMLLPLFGDLCLPRSDLRSSLMRALSGWYPRHLFGIFITSLPSVAAYSAISCAMFEKLPGSDQFYCLLVVTTLLHYCNFTMLSSWMKSVLATVAGLVLLILIGIGICAESSSVGDIGLNETTTTISEATTTVQSVFKEIFAGDHPLQYEIILDVALLLVLVWFLNREMEISYRLCFHGDVEAVSDRQKIQFEKEQADWLLHNIVPEHVAHLLKTHEVYSETYKNVGIIFAKISNFDDFYDEAYEGGKEYLRVLNELMGDFEELFDSPKYKDVEKIKTIGACLMAASGLNSNTRKQNRDPIAHLYALMDFSLDLLKKLDQFNKDILNFTFEMEVGYNYGEVTAGVVGTTKLLYDIWGDAVNVASRMYSTGVHGRIQVTQDTAELLADKFEFEHRGTVFVKGKGDMNTYLLKCKKPGATWD